MKRRYFKEWACLLTNGCLFTVWRSQIASAPHRSRSVQLRYERDQFSNKKKFFSSAAAFSVEVRYYACQHVAAESVLGYNSTTAFARAWRSEQGSIENEHASGRQANEPQQQNVHMLSLPHVRHPICRHAHCHGHHLPHTSLLPSHPLHSLAEQPP